jgi:outer membrane receptor protein involved in Fe transport
MTSCRAIRLDRVGTGVDRFVMGLENLKKSLLRAGGLLCLAALVSPGIASAASSEGDALEEIVVTANKRSESLDKVGSAIQVLSAATLDQQHVTSLQDLAAAVPGLTYTQSEYGTPVYTLRVSASTTRRSLPIPMSASISTRRRCRFRCKPC